MCFEIIRVSGGKYIPNDKYAKPKTVREGIFIPLPRLNFPAELIYEIDLSRFLDIWYPDGEINVKYTADLNKALGEVYRKWGVDREKIRGLRDRDLLIEQRNKARFLPRFRKQKFRARFRREAQE